MKEDHLRHAVTVVVATAVAAVIVRHQHLHVVVDADTTPQVIVISPGSPGSGSK